MRDLIRLIPLSIAFGLFAGAGAAVELSLPATARQTFERNTNPDVHLAPISVFDGQKVPSRKVEGAVQRSAWRLDSPGLTPLQVMQPLRQQLEAAGYDIILDCSSIECGGFDFRFGTETIPGPHMYVNIRAFHFITATRGGETGPSQETVTIMASTNATSAYIQIIQVGLEKAPSTDGANSSAAPSTLAVGMQPDEIGQKLTSHGHAVLHDLDFESGTSTLGDARSRSLESLAVFMKTEPTARVALVGHTDSVGSLANNIALSRKRAEVVRQRLIQQYGLDGARVEAEGVGYLAPIASNLTKDGRDKNRRVEAVLLSTGQ